MVIIQNNIFFRLRLRRLAFRWRLGPQITLYSRTLFSRITSLICFFFTCIFCCRRQSYVHNINESSCGMTGTPDHFGYCGCWFSPWTLLLASLQSMLLKRKHRKLLLFLFFFFMCVKCCSCAIRLVKQPKKGWDVPSGILDWTLRFFLEEERKKGEKL